MTAAIEKGIPKLRIEESAARVQAKIDSGERVIYGVNKFPPHFEEEVPVLSVDNEKVRTEQIANLAKLRSTRNQGQVEKVLEELTRASQNRQENLLEKCVECARAKATVGEMSEAMAKVFGRHEAKIQTVQGVYAKAMSNTKEIEETQKLVSAFKEEFGRRPRILLAKMGQDGHDRGQKVIATAFADLGFDVDIGPLFQTPKEVAKQASENDVHLIGVSSLAAGHLTLVPELKKELLAIKREDISIVVGGVIPPADFEKLFKMGVLGVFGPGTVIAKASREVLEKLTQYLRSQ